MNLIQIQFLGAVMGPVRNLYLSLEGHLRVWPIGGTRGDPPMGTGKQFSPPVGRGVRRGARRSGNGIIHPAFPRAWPLSRGHVGLRNERPAHPTGPRLPAPVSYPGHRGSEKYQMAEETGALGCWELFAHAEKGLQSVRTERHRPQNYSLGKYPVGSIPPSYIRNGIENKYMFINH